LEDIDISKVTNRTTCLMMSVLLLVGLCTAAAGKIIYVDDDVAGANDGSSWENAYFYLQDALADANSAEKPVEINVAQGGFQHQQDLMMIVGDSRVGLGCLTSLETRSWPIAHLP